MSTENLETTTNNALQVKKPSQAKEIWRRFRKNKGALIGLIMLAGILIIVLSADLIVPYEVGTT